MKQHILIAGQQFLKSISTVKYKINSSWRCWASTLTSVPPAPLPEWGIPKEPRTAETICSDKKWKPKTVRCKTPFGMLIYS